MTMNASRRQPCGHTSSWVGPGLACRTGVTNDPERIQQVSNETLDESDKSRGRQPVMTRPRDRVALQRAEHHRLRPAGSRDSGGQAIVSAGFDRSTNRRRRPLGIPTLMQQSATLDANQDGTTCDPAEDRMGLPATSRAGVHQRCSMLRADHGATSRPVLPQIRRPIVCHVAAQAGRTPRNLRHRYG
jgi:hypothetical protein